MRGAVAPGDSRLRGNDRGKEMGIELSTFPRITLKAGIELL